MTVKSAKYPANIVSDLKEYIGDYRVVNISIGPDNGYYILAVSSIPQRIDGIQDIKVTDKNVIWTSYFDEGVFGNYGWDEPIGSCGLRAWNEEGEPVYIHDNNDRNFICDCYALNIVSDNEVWFYYYSDFLLGNIRGGKIDYYDPKLSGADGFLIYDRYVLFRGGYNNQDEYRLFEFVKNSYLKEKRKITFTDENDKIIIANAIDCRGSRLILMVGSVLYDIDLIDII